MSRYYMVLIEVLCMLTIVILADTFLSICGRIITNFIIVNLSFFQVPFSDTLLLMPLVMQLLWHPSE